MRFNKLAASLIVSGLLLPGAALATNGYFSHGYGIKSKSMGGVGIALPQDAMAAANNPANMVLVGDRIDFGVDWFMPDRTATWDGTPTGPVINGAYAISNGEYRSGNRNFLVPEFGYNRMINDKMSLGVSVYGNGGMNTDYGKVVIAGATSNTYSNLEQLFIAPTFSMKVADKHSIGVSLNFAYQTFEARGLESFDVAGQTTSIGSVTNQGKDTSTGWGLRVGWTGQITPNVTVGATYQSKTRMSKFDKYKGLFAEQGSFDIPENYGIGIAVKASDKLTIAGDVVQINYGDIRSLSNPGVLFPGVAAFTGRGGMLGADDGAGFGWRDQTVFKLGMTYQYAPNLQLRAGYNYARMPLTEQNTFFNILAPATVEQHLTLGATWTLANKSELTLSYMHAFNKSINGVSNGNGGCNVPMGCGLPTAVDGHPVNLKMNQNALGIAYGWKM